MGFSFTTPMIIGSIILVLVIIIFIYRNYLSTDNEIDEANKTATTEDEKDVVAASSKAA